MDIEDRLNRRKSDWQSMIEERKRLLDSEVARLRLTEWLQAAAKGLSRGVTSVGASSEEQNHHKGKGFVQRQWRIFDGDGGNPFADILFGVLTDREKCWIELRTYGGAYRRFPTSALDSEDLADTLFHFATDR